FGHDVAEILPSSGGLPVRETQVAVGPDQASDRLAVEVREPNRENVVRDVRPRRPGLTVPTGGIDGCTDPGQCVYRLPGRLRLDVRGESNRAGRRPDVESL